MALAISAVTTFKDSGQEFRATVTVQGSSTYTTGGQAVSFKHPKIKTKAKPSYGIGFSKAGWMAVYDVANNKVMIWNGTTEFGSGADVSSVVLYMTFWFPKA